MTHVPGDDHAAQLVDDEHVEWGRRLAELLLQDLQDGLHDPRSVPQSHRDVAQGPNGVVRDQLGLPGHHNAPLLPSYHRHPAVIPACTG